MFSLKNDLDTARPCMVLADSNPVYEAVVERFFRRIGWDVFTARGGPEVRHLARMLTPNLVLIGTDLPDESGWLTCDKMTSEFPNLRVILVGANLDEVDQRFAKTVGARAIIERDDRHPGMIADASSLELATMA